MDGNLRERDLVIIGFWTDWCYLNKIIGDALHCQAWHVQVREPARTRLFGTTPSRPARHRAARRTDRWRPAKAIAKASPLVE
jgi:hypothetical protein